MGTKQLMYDSAICCVDGLIEEFEKFPGTIIDKEAVIEMLKEYKQRLEIERLKLV